MFYCITLLEFSVKILVKPLLCFLNFFLDFDATDSLGILLGLIFIYIYLYNIYYFFLTFNVLDVMKF